MINKELLKIASNTENFGVIDKYTHFSKLKNQICGDEMKIYLIIKGDKILKFKYHCQSCIFCQASVSLLSRKAINKSVEKVNNFQHIVGKDPDYNAEKIKEIFKGEDNDFSIAVCLNAAAGLLVAEKSNSFNEGYQELRKHILSGKVINHISKLSK